MLFATGLLAQTAPPAITGSISGRIFDADTRLPVRGAHVTANGKNDGITDSDGRYSILNLSPGKYSIGNKKDMGAALGVDQNVTVTAGRSISGIDFYFRLFSEISGRVLDGDGNPISGMQVEARSKEYLSYTGANGNQTRTDQLSLNYRPARALTDDQGRYLIENLLAGRQYWIIAEKPRLYSNPISESPADPQLRKRTLAATYYPNANSVDTALPVVPHSLELRDNVDIHMLSAPSYCLEATLTAGGVPTSMNFLLHPTEEPYRSLLPSINLPRSSVTSGDGRIRLCDLYPGRFELIAARLGGNEQEFLGATDIVISNTDVRNLVINAMSRSKVAGEFVWDNPATASSTTTPITIRTFPTPNRPVPENPVVPGKFSLDVMAGIAYIPVISDLDSHFYIKDIAYRGVSILNKLFRPDGSEEKLRITIGRDAGSISAKINGIDTQPAVGAAVLFLPVTAQTEGEVVSTIFAGVTDDTGSYHVTGLPPGKYDVFATREPPPSVLYGSKNVLLIDRTPETIGKVMRARARGQRIEVGPNANAQVNLAPIILE
jgi:hypothetical protein